MTEKPRISLSVRELVTFVLQTGNLAGQGEFRGSNRALEGTRGHQRLQKARPAAYQPEVQVAWQFEAPAFILELKGRIDGVLVESGSLLIEEIKTVRSLRPGPADPLHLAQAKIYAHLFCQQEQILAATVRITYLDLGSGETREIDEVFPAQSLKSFFDSVIHEYLDWITQHQAWCARRDESIRQLGFPFASYRAGQRSLAVAVYRTIKSRARLFAEAPTGIGKTVSVLFPAIKALGERRVEKIFYSTAKTVGRVVAEKTVADLRASGLHLRSLTLTARDKICFNDGHPCDVVTCPYAIGYYDRIKTALRAALQKESFTRPEIEEIARTHQVCPFELSLDLSLWVDLVICDYNYLFDPTASLKRFFDDEKHDYALLIDEAHNLVDRAREMFSADLSRTELAAVQHAIKSHLPACAKTLAKINTQISRLTKGEEWLNREGTLVSPLPPSKIRPALKKFIEQAELWLVQNEPSDFRQPLLELYFRVLAFERTLEIFDERYVSIFDPASGLLRLFCVDPSSSLRAMTERSGSAIFFSATLRPADYFHRSLGGDPVDSIIQLDSPFPTDNLHLLVNDRIATRLKARETSYDAVAESVAATVNARNGNYLVFFPSYAYLEAVLQRFRDKLPEVRAEVQTSAMTEAQRESFLNQFKTGTHQTLVAFAVLGGVFGEGIDLIGERLIGVIVVGVGLPQISVERDLIRDYWQSQDRPGFDYGYTFPGLSRVLQAVGRVIRSEKDRGVVLLIDERFRQPTYRALFPSWWKTKTVRSVHQIAEAAAAFWNDQPASSESPSNVPGVHSVPTIAKPILKTQTPPLT